MVWASVFLAEGVECQNICWEAQDKGDDEYGQTQPFLALTWHGFLRFIQPVSSRCKSVAGVEALHEL